MAAKPSRASAIMPVLENNNESDSPRPKAARAASSFVIPAPSKKSSEHGLDDSDDATGSSVKPTAASTSIVPASNAASVVIAAPSAESASSIASINPFPVNTRSVQQQFSFQQGGDLIDTNKESLKTDTLTMDTIYQLTSPLFDYIRVLFDPIYSILQRPEFELTVGLLEIIPLLHACMNIKLPGIYHIANIDPNVKTCIDTMLGATKQFISTLTKSEKKTQFLEQLRILPRVRLTSLLGPSSNSNHYKDPSTFPSIRFLSLGVNFTVKAEATNVPTGFFNKNDLYLSNTPETSTTDKIKGLLSSNSNKKIKLYKLDWNTIKASKASLDLQTDKEINPDTLEIDPEVLFNDSELFLKTIMIVHRIFPGWDTFKATAQPEAEQEAAPKEETEAEQEAAPKEETEAEQEAAPKEETEAAPKTESTCKTKLVAKECEGTPSERKKQYRKQTVVLHPDKHSTDGCEKEASQAFKDLQSMESCTETNENTVAPSNTVVAPTTTSPLALTTNAVVPTNTVPQTNATVASTTTNTTVAPTTNVPTNTTAIVIPNQVK
jgi:hypothetical protein